MEASNKPNNLDKWIYLEKPSTFADFSKNFRQKTPVARYWQLLRSIGVIEGTIKEWHPESKTGKIDIEGHEYDFKVEKKNSKSSGFDKLIGNKTRFSFWPNLDDMPQKKGKKFSRFSCLKICGPFKNDTVETGYVEIVGKLEQIWSNEFLISMWSRSLQKLLYVPVASEYPFPDELGECIKVSGKFDPKSGVIRLDETNVIAFVPPEEMKNIQLPQENRKKNRPGGPDRNQKNNAARYRKQKEMKRKLKTLPVEKISLLNIIPPKLQESDKLSPGKFKAKYELIKQLYRRQGKTPSPLVLKPLNSGKYLLVDGLIRLKIANELGYNTIDAYILRDDRT